MLFRNKFKVSAVIVFLSIIMQIMPSVSYAVTHKYEQTPPVYETVIYHKDGTNSSDMRGNFNYGTDFDGDKCYSLGNSNIIRQMFFNFENVNSQGVSVKNEDGQCMVSFDVLSTDLSDGLVMWFHDVGETKTSGYSPFYITGKGQMCINENVAYQAPRCTDDTDNGFHITENRWYNIKMVFYTEEQYIDFYIDNAYWGRNYMPTPYMMNSKYGGDRRPYEIFFNYMPNWNVDENGNELPKDATGGFLIDNFTFGIPKQRKYEIDFWRNEVGNIYDGSDVDFGCDIINRSGAGDTFVFTYDIRTDKNKSVANDSVRCYIGGNNRKSLSLLSYAPEYGFYICKAKLENSKGEVVFEDSTRFSIISPQNGLNQKMGVNIHNFGHGYSSYGSIENTLEVVEKLGMSSTRDVYAWVSLYENDGETPKSGSSINMTNEKFGRTEIKNLAVVSIFTEAYDLKYDDASVPDLLLRYGKYCRQLALDMDPDVTPYFEIENEWWLKGNTDYSGIKYDTDISADVKLYAEMIKIASREIRSVRPDAKIAVFTSSMLSYNWTKAVLDALGDNPGQYFDIISIHDYMASFNSKYPEQHMTTGDTRESGKTLLLKLFKEYGIDDKEIWSSEFGTTTGYTKRSVDEKLNGDFYVRHFMYDTQYMDKIYIYQLQNNRFKGSDYENGFGITRDGTKQEIPIEALPAALELAAFNSILNNSRYVSSQVIGNDGMIDDSGDILIYKYIMGDGRDCYVIFALNLTQNVSFNFGVDSALVYDEYGNEKSIDAYRNYITLSISTAPTYVVADDLRDTVYTKSTPYFTVPSEIYAPINGTMTFEVTDNSWINADIRVDCSMNTSFDGIYEKKSGKSKIGIVTFDNRQNIDKYKFDDGVNKEEITVSFVSGNKVYYSEQVMVSYDTSLVTQSKRVPFSVSQWNRILGQKSNRRISPITGEYEALEGVSEKLSEMLSKESGKILFDIPDSVLKQKTQAE